MLQDVQTLTAVLYVAEIHANVHISCQKTDVSQIY